MRMMPERRLPMHDEAQDAAERQGCRVRRFGQISADSVALLGDGRLLAISPPQALRDGRLLQETYGIAFTLRSALLPLLEHPHI